ncbi:MAG: hypothetical protein FJ109_11440 [Deltaproteobacteria bacterium]|nr:hypothetical protein [Deltaproteobacteria bacterium]
MMRAVCTAVSLLVLVGCSGEGGPAIVAGDFCSESEADQTRCGKSPQGVDAVLICQSVKDLYQWAVSQECPGGCKKSTCLAGGNDVTFMDWGKSGDDNPTADTDIQGPKPDVIVEDEKEEDALLCDPGSIACEDEYTSKTCNWFGTAWELEPCEAGQGCDLGYCMDQVCTPWELGGECMGPSSYKRCAGSGVKWEPGYCQAPLTCYEGSCVPWVCLPGDLTCKGMTAPQECQLEPDGENTKWEVIQLCQGGLCKDGACVSACDVNLKDNSYMGCDYYAVDLDNVEGGQYQPVAVVVSVPTTEAGNAEITITNMAANPPVDLGPGELGVQDMLVAGRQLKIFMLPTEFGIDGSVLTNKTFRVKSTAPVTVHEFNPLNGENVFTNDASLLLPSNVGGQEYLVMAWPMRTEGYSLRGFAAVVATQEGTTKVDLWPTSAVLSGSNVQSLAPNPQDPYTFYLNMGDVLNIETDGAQGSDLTGTRIVSDKKVSVFGGHECANIPLGTNYCDHVEQQLIPVPTWGTHYIGDAFKARNAAQKDVFRVLAGADNVKVTLNPSVAGPYILQKGQWVEFYSGTSFEVVATGPVLLGHYLQGSNYAGFSPHPQCSFGTGIGDPAFTLGIPMEQYLKEYIVLTPPAYIEDYVNIMAKIGTEGSITIDGNPVNAPFVPAGASGYAVAQVSVSDGVHTIKGSEVFGVTAYGYDCDVSYAYPGGLSLKSLQ